METTRNKLMSRFESLSDYHERKRQYGDQAYEFWLEESIAEMSSSSIESSAELISQLLEQRDEAMEVLKFAKNALNKFQRSYGTYECEAYLRIEKLIQKTNPAVKQQS